VRRPRRSGRPVFQHQCRGRYFRAQGATVTELDIDDTPSLSDPYRTVKAGFVAARPYCGQPIRRCGGGLELPRRPGRAVLHGGGARLFPENLG
jgi:hypothetical protein